MPATIERDYEFGKFILSSEKLGYRVLCDRAAVSREGTLYLLSIAAAAQKVKGIGAALNSNASVCLSIEETPLYVGETFVRSSMQLDRAEGGYRRFLHKWNYGWVHALYVSRAVGFLPSVCEEAIWQELNTNRITTPLLRSWMPYLTDRLLETKGLEYLPGHRCQCGLLTATTEDVDRIVTEGIRSRMLGKDFHPRKKRTAS
jgi:hypothetical protein